MTFTGALGLIVLGIVAIALLGPSKLPAGVEQTWLMITNFRRSQAELPLLTLEQARRSWQAGQSPLYDLVQILYASVEHLVELRRRIFTIIAAMLASSTVAAFFVQQILDLLVKPKGDVQLMFLAPTDMVMVYIEVVIGMAVVITLPVIVYEILMFVRPGLESPQELKAFTLITWIGVPLVLFFFVSGIVFAYFLVLPVMLQTLAGFGGTIAKAAWSIRFYYTFVINVLLWIGLAFETPLVMAIVARLGVVAPNDMAKKWRYAIVGAAVLAAVITPTVDPINMMLVMGPLVVLYFVGIVMARLVYRPRAASIETAASS